MLSPSGAETAPILPISNDCSRQSNLDSRTVEARLRPDVCQSVSSTSKFDRAFAVVTAATITSVPSVQRTKTGRFFVPPPLVNGILATQNSPGRIVIVQPFVLGCETIHKRRVIANRSPFCPGGFGRRRYRQRDN